MIAKPSSCKGCPLYGDGQGFVPDRVVEGAEVFILAQNPGADEEAGRRLVQYVGKDRVYESVPPQPLTGATGYALEHEYLPLAGLSREQVSYGNVIKCRWQPSPGKRTNDLPPAPVLREAVEHCTKAHLVIPPSTKLVVAHGQPSWDWAAGVGTVSTWRGYTAPPRFPASWVPYCTVHTSAIFRTPRLRPAAQADWRKIPRILAGAWPQAVPSFLQVPHDVGVADPQVRQELDAIPRLVVDTEFLWDQETIRGEYPLTVIGIGGRDNEGRWRGVQVDCRVLSVQDVRWFIKEVYTPLVKTKPVIFQNAGADVPVLRNAGGPDWEVYHRIEDLMLLHFHLYSEQPHDLEYLASIAGVLPKLKHLASQDLLRYNLGDVVETFACFEVFEKEGVKDPGVWKLYREEALPLVPIHTEATRLGIRVNKAMVLEVLKERTSVTQEAEKVARAYTGWPLNLASVGPSGHLATVLYHQLRLPKQVNRATKSLSVDADSIASLRQAIGPAPDTEAENRDGLTIDQALARIEQGANPLLEARVVYAAALQEVSHYLAPLIKGGKGGDLGDLLEKAKAGEVVDRIHPQFAIHAQANHRWSTTNPPLGQLPSHLEALFIPDEGWPWFMWDWDTQELRLIAAIAKDKPLLDAFKGGHDVHTLTMCEVFGYRYPDDRVDPHKGVLAAGWRKELGWQGKKDGRRTFAKQFFYSLNYGKKPKNAIHIPGAKTLGFTAKKLEDAARRLLAAHPALAQWRARTRDAALRTRMARDFMGGRRVFHGVGEDVVRAAYDYPMQAGGVRVFNQTLLAIYQRFGGVVQFKYQQHDSCIIAIREDWFRKEVLLELADLVQREWDVAGVTTRIPATFYIWRPGRKKEPWVPEKVTE